MDGSLLPSDRRTFLVGAAALALSACGGGAKGGRTKLVLGDQVHLMQSRAEASGVLDDLPYDIEWANFVGAAPLLEALNAGAVDTAPAGDLPVILAAAAKAPLKIIAATRFDTRDIGILARPDVSVRRVSDLAGRSVIVSSARGSIAHYLLLEAIKEAKVDPKAVEIGFMLPNDAAAAFAAGRIDIWATFGTYQIAAELSGARLIRDGEGINSPYALIAAHQGALSDAGKRAALRDLMARQQKAALWAAGHPDGYAALIVKQTGVDPRVAAIMARRQRGLLVAPDAAVIAPLQRVVDRFYADGELPAHVDVASIVDPGIFPA
ncbi:MAG: ABC transporter substrate-binding protein [Sphingobium sp.]